jgi:hypothetical protein
VPELGLDPPALDGAAVEFVDGAVAEHRHVVTGVDDRHIRREGVEDRRIQVRDALSGGQYGLAGEGGVRRVQIAQVGLIAPQVTWFEQDVARAPLMSRDGWELRNGG